MRMRIYALSPTSTFADTRSALSEYAGSRLTIPLWRLTMNNKLNLKAAVAASFTIFLLSYLLCIASDILFGWTMVESWLPLVPGLTWPLTSTGFLIGLVWVAVYSLYVPALFVLPYNYVVSRRADQ
jgi:hypothetical protein